MCKNRGKTITTQGAHVSLLGILSFFPFLMVKRIEEVIQLSNNHVVTAKGWTCEQL